MKTNLRAVLFLIGLFLAVSNSLVLAHTDVTAEQARDLTDSTPEIVVVDVREPYEYCSAAGHIPGALNYPWSSGVLQARHEELRTDGLVLVVCASGGRSNAAANFLDSKGFSQVYDMLGGMSAWLWETAPCKYSGGSGTPGDPYQIATATDLIALGETPEDYDKNFILTADIDLDPNLPGRKVFDKAVIAPLSAINVYPWTEGLPFTGVFDGNGHTISHLTIVGEGYLGLFGQLGKYSTQTPSGAEVRDLGVVDVSIAGSNDYVGGLVGDNRRGSLTQCWSSGVVSGDDYVGGLAGNNDCGVVMDCASTVEVRGTNSVGGLVGDNSYGDIASSHSSGTVSGRGKWSVGGLVGRNMGTVIHCDSTAVVSGNRRVGGLVGYNNTGTIDASYSAGPVDGNDVVGGLVGNNFGDVNDCYSTGAVTGTGSATGGLVGENDIEFGIMGGTISASVSRCYSTGIVVGSIGVGGLVGINAAHVSDCYSTGAVSGGDRVGGLIGDNDCDIGFGWGFSGSVSRCYSTGFVTGDTAVGGLVGNNCQKAIHSEVIDCFWDTQTSGQIRSDGATGRTTAEMQTANTFLEAGWDFVGETANGSEDIWKIAEGLGYPRLWWEKYSGGTGEADDPYRIYTVEHLNEMGAEPNDWDKHFRLMADVDLAGYVYDAALIAPDGDPNDPAFQGTSFTGVFDGNGHVLSNLTIGGAGYLGLFGRLNPGAEVANLELLDVSISGGDYVAGLVGFNSGSIKACGVTGEITGNERVGGLAGRNWGSIAASCTAGTVTGVHDVGGLVPGNYGKIAISYSTAAVSGNKDAGGLVAENYGSIADSYSTGTVAANINPGGLVAYNWPDAGTISGFWDVEASGLATSDGGTGRTTAQMQTASTFLDAGWDFVDETANGTEDIWWILEGRDYPRLWWEAGRAIDY